MKNIKLIVTKLLDNDDFRSGLKIKLGNIELSFIDGGEPEDNSLGRDWNDVYKIQRLVESVYKLGQENPNKELEIEKVEVDLDSF
jgi:ubiquitin-protein ligase